MTKGKYDKATQLLEDIRQAEMNLAVPVVLPDFMPTAMQERYREDLQGVLNKRLAVACEKFDNL